jgi:hypothetical protein
LYSKRDARTDERAAAALSRRGLHLDHVVFEEGARGALKAVSAAAAMSEADVRQGMPNARSPSDHAMVAAVFDFAAPGAAAGAVS